MTVSDTPLLAVDYNSDMKEEDFFTAALYDLVWSEESIPDRQLSIHMAPDNSATGYFSQLPIPPQEPIYKPEWEPMDDTDDDIPTLFNIPKKCFFQIMLKLY